MNTFLLFPESDIVSYRTVKKFMIWNNAFFNSCDDCINSDSDDNLISPLDWISTMWGKILFWKGAEQPFISQKAYPLH